MSDVKTRTREAAQREYYAELKSLTTDPDELARLTKFEEELDARAAAEPAELRPHARRRRGK